MMNKIRNIGRSSGFSKLTIGWGAFIIVSALFMSQVNDRLTALVGDPFLIKSFYIFSSLIFISVLTFMVRARLGGLRIAGLFFIGILCIVLGSLQDYYSEKTHIITYGLLGYLALRDMTRCSPGTKKQNMVTAMAFVLLICLLDEGLQFMLPYRWGDIRDIITSLISGAFGASLYLIVQPHRNLKDICR